jgi:tetratricopeptide (TPR) repeat protein
VRPRAAFAVALVGLAACQKQAAPPSSAPPAVARAAAGGPLGEGRSLLEQGQLDAALEKLTGAPSSAESLYWQGMVWAKKAETAPLPTPPPLVEPLARGAAAPAAPEFKPEELTAIGLFENAIATDAQFARAHLGLADVLAPHALRSVELAAAREKGGGRRGGRHAKTPEPAAAPAGGPDASAERVVREYRLAAQWDPAAKPPVENLITFCQRTGRWDDADAAFQELLKRDREKPEPFIRYGDFLRERKNVDGAIAQYEQALIWKSDDDATKAKIADIYIGIAAAHFEQKEYATAQARLRDAQRWITDKSSPQAQRIADLQSQLAQIRMPAGR